MAQANSRARGSCARARRADTVATGHRTYGAFEIQSVALDETISLHRRLDRLRRRNARGRRLVAGALTLTEHIPLWPTGATDAAATMACAALDADRVFIPEILHPVEVSSGQEGHLVQWLSRRLSYPMRLPDLKPEGFTLVGGRLLSGPDGPVAVFMFENAAGTRLTLYFGRLKPVTDTSFRYSDAGGVLTIYWTSDDIGFALTGPVVRDTLQRIAQLSSLRSWNRNPSGRLDPGKPKGFLFYDSCTVVRRVASGASSSRAI
jgi:anti-sigma factor RsiW